MIEWPPTRDALHGYAQVLGAVRRHLAPPQKHWWHISLRIDATGLTTTPMPAPDGRAVTLRLDLADHALVAARPGGRMMRVPLLGQSVDAFRQETEAALAALGVEVDMAALESEGNLRDETPHSYNPRHAARFRDVLMQVHRAFAAFRAGLREETSPIQLWPHHFDLAMLWLSGRHVEDADPDDPEQADEQMNVGFVPGDAAIEEPYFYATAYPQPDGFVGADLPTEAHWHTEGFTAAILPYAAFSEANDPHGLLLDFLRQAHAAGAEAMRSR